MNHAKTSLFAAGIALVALTGLAACSGSVSSSMVEYRVSTTGAQLGKVSYHTVQPGAGAVDFEDRVRKQTWSKTVDGGRSPSVSVEAPADGTATCEIRTTDGKTLAREDASNGSAATCAAGDKG